MDILLQQARAIVQEAIDLYRPSHIISLYSGGYDSLITTHVAHRLYLPIPLYVYSVDTRLSADGWREYVCQVAADMGWRHDIYDNLRGFNQFVGWVEENGCPYSKKGHNRSFNRLKGRAIDLMLKDHKQHDHDKVLFISGIRKDESEDRRKLKDPIQARPGKSSAVYCNPIFYWLDEDVLAYRLDNDLPENPFYETVGGSGDCQCNWGNFITLEKLRRHSPKLAAGNVALLDRTSQTYHGYGWDDKPVAKGQDALFDLSDDDEGVITPFLCSGCSRKKSPGHYQAQEARYLQTAMF